MVHLAPHSFIRKFSEVKGVPPHAKGLVSDTSEGAQRGRGTSHLRRKWRQLLHTPFTMGLPSLNPLQRRGTCHDPPSAKGLCLSPPFSEGVLLSIPSPKGVYYTALTRVTIPEKHFNLPNALHRSNILHMNLLTTNTTICANRKALCK